MGGRVDVGPTAEGGTRFVVALPAATDGARVDVVAYDGGRVEAVDDVDFGFVELVVDAPGGRVVVVAVVVVVSSGS